MGRAREAVLVSGVNSLLSSVDPRSVRELGGITSDLVSRDNSRPSSTPGRRNTNNGQGTPGTSVSSLFNNSVTGALVAMTARVGGRGSGAEFVSTLHPLLDRSEHGGTSRTVGFLGLVRVLPLLGKFFGM